MNILRALFLFSSWLNKAVLGGGQNHGWFEKKAGRATMIFIPRKRICWKWADAITTHGVLVNIIPAVALWKPSIWLLLIQHEHWIDRHLCSCPLKGQTWVFIYWSQSLDAYSFRSGFYPGERSDADYGSGLAWRPDTSLCLADYEVSSSHMSMFWNDGTLCHEKVPSWIRLMEGNPRQLWR